MIRTYGLAILVFVALSACSVLAADGPPFCPHINSWNSTVQNWAQGAPWIKVLSALDASRAKDMGSKVFYRPYDIPGIPGHDDGGTGDGRGMAEAVLARLSTIPSSKWPDAIGYRNEFGGNDTTTPQQFIHYYDRLRAGGYTGWIVFGSYSTGVPESYRWSQTDVKNAVLKADAVETHEYFDLTESFCHTWLCCRHVRFINENPYLLGKPWFIGEAGSDRISGGCHEDPCNRRGWRHFDCGAQKLTEQQYIAELSKYRSLCAPQVPAVFIFQQGDQWNWNDFEVVGTSVGTWMQSTWGISEGAISGVVRTAAGQGLPGAAVTTNPGGYSATTNASGGYAIPNVPAGTYDVTASKPGYIPDTQSGKSVSGGSTTVVNFTLNPAPPGVELLTNGDFESGCTGWAHSESPAGIYWGCGNKAYPGTGGGAGGHSWNAFLACGGYFCDKSFTGEQHQDNVPVTPGAYYTASAKVYYEPVAHPRDATDCKERIVLVFNNGIIHASEWRTHTTYNGWDTITLSGFVPAGTLSMTFRVEVSHTDGQWSGTGGVDECSFISQAPCPDISTAKSYADGTVLRLSDKTVSAVANGAFWIQESDRTSGIRVNAVNTLPVGAKVDVAGALATVNGERVLQSAVSAVR